MLANIRGPVLFNLRPVKKDFRSAKREDRGYLHPFAWKVATAVEELLRVAAEEVHLERLEHLVYPQIEEPRYYARVPVCSWESAKDQYEYAFCRIDGIVAHGTYAPDSCEPGEQDRLIGVVVY